MDERQLPVPGDEFFEEEEEEDDGISDLFEVPEEEEDLSDILSVDSEDIMGRAPRRKVRRIVRTPKPLYPPAPPPVGGIGY